MKKVLFYSFILIVWLAGATSVGAQANDTYTLLEPLPNLETGTEMQTIKIDDYISYIFKFAIAIAVFLATVMIIIGGFEYMLSESVTKKESAKKKFWDAGMGLLGALTCYLVLQTIDPRLVNVSTTIEPICTGKTEENIKLCKKNQTADFARELQDDFRNLSREKRDAVIAIEPRRLYLENVKKELEEELGDGKISEDEYLKQSTPISTELADIQVEQYKIASEGLGLTQFNIVHKELYNTTGSPNYLTLNQYTAEVVSDDRRDGKLPTVSPNLIQQKYNESINKILAITPQTEKTREYASLLSKQRNFFIAQVREEVMLHSMLLGVVKKDASAVEVINTDGTKYIVKNNENKELIRIKIKTYETLLQNPQNSVDAGIPQEEYRKIMQTRIDMANKLLNEK